VAKKASLRAPADAGAWGTAQDYVDAVQKAFLPQIEESPYFSGKKLTDVAAGRALLALDRPTQAEVVRVALGRLADLEPKVAATPISRRQKLWMTRWVLMETIRSLLRRSLPLSEADVIRLLDWPVRASDLPAHQSPFFISPHIFPLSGLAAAAENFVKENGISPPLRKALEPFVEKLKASDHDRECRKIADRLDAFLTGGPQIALEPGEAWSDAALTDLGRMKPKARQAWDALLLHCQAGGRGKYSERWRADAEPLLDRVGFDAVKEHALRWFPLVDKPRTIPSEREHELEPDSWLRMKDQLLKEPHVELLRGVVWCCAFREDAELARALARLALSAYRKIPGKGPRLVALGNACVTALGLMPGQAPIGQLAVLKVKVKFGTAQKEIEKAFTAAANREGLPPEEIE
jgi:hypothetical protein